jgi:hypothetical protein
MGPNVAVQHARCRPGAPWFKGEASTPVTVEPLPGRRVGLESADKVRTARSQVDAMKGRAPLPCFGVT